MVAGEFRKQKAIFAAVDGIALATAFSGALALHDPAAAIRTELLKANPFLAALGVAALLGMWLLVFYAFGLYEIPGRGRPQSTVIARACATAILLTLFAGFLAHVQVSRITVGLAYAFSVLAVSIGRRAVRISIRYLYANPNIVTPLVVIGFNPVARYLMDQILDELTQYEPVGFLADDVGTREYRGFPVVGPVAQLERLAAMCPGLKAAIALPEEPRERQEEIVAICDQHRVAWALVPSLYRSVSAGMSVDMVGVVPLVSRRGSNVEGLNFALKRIFDIGAGTLALVLSAPLIAVGAMAVYLFDGWPVFIRQVRVGIRGRTFDLLKLRTMRTGCDDSVHRQFAMKWIGNQSVADSTNGRNGAPIFKIVNDNRVTRVGRILRRFSIDELPQLLNVVRGEMSLIGPRPALPYEIEGYQTWHRRRLDAVPGLTGLWQVSGRNRISFDGMVRLDLQYLEQWSLREDLKILVRTIPVLLRGEGV